MGCLAQRVDNSPRSFIPDTQLLAERGGRHSFVNKKHSPEPIPQRHQRTPKNRLCERMYLFATLRTVKSISIRYALIYAPTGAFSAVERVKGKLQARSIRGEVLAELFEAVFICLLHRMILRMMVLFRLASLRSVPSNAGLRESLHIRLYA